MYNSNTFIFLFLCFCRDSSKNGGTGLDIRVDGDGTNVELNVKGKNTFNSNGFAGMFSSLDSNANLEINVESSATLKSCGNAVADINGNVNEGATVEFSGTGYTCDQDKVEFFVFGDGTVVKPVCQACPP